MIKNRVYFTSILFLLLNFVSQSASAFDFQVFTWERGKIQQVILGETKRGTDWKVEMVGEGIEPIKFLASAQNDAGYYVFTAEIPSDTPLGAYSIEATGDDGPKRIIAGISLIEIATYDIRKSVDLTIVVGLLTFLTVTFSSLRALKYSRLRPVTIKDPVIEIDGDKKRIQKLVSSILNFRARLTNGVNPSLLRHLLSQESELLLRFFKFAYYLFPVVGISLGIISGLDAQSEGGFENTNLLFFFLIVLVGLIDAFSGIMALFAFWIVQFYFGEISNLTDLMILSAAAVAWIGPSLLSRLYQDAIVKDLTSSRVKIGLPVVRAFSILGAALSATAIFFGGHMLLQSLIVEVSRNQDMKEVYLVAVGVVAAIKATFIAIFEDRGKVEEVKDFEVVRVASPQISTLVFFLVFGYSYLWTGNFSGSLIAAVLFAAPYFLLFVRFETLGITSFAKIKRNIFLESTLAVGASLIIYNQIQRLPQLSEQRAEVFLMTAAIPALFHGLYSSICDSAQRKERIEP